MRPFQTGSTHAGVHTKRGSKSVRPALKTGDAGGGRGKGSEEEDDATKFHGEKNNYETDAFRIIRSSARSSTRSLARIAHLLADSALLLRSHAPLPSFLRSLAHSLAPELVGKRFVFMM